ncbi:MAG TPA: LapA family protein [Ilumatobacteraceae bacterium]|jgi:uncharacterized integral membrane protein|nr:LapA family protein [Ilumatobacteraceae bacterium]
MATPDRDTSTSENTTGAPADRDAEPETIRDYRGTGVVWGGVLVLVLAVGLIIVAFQNGQDVEFDFLWIESTAPLVLILAITIAVAIVVDEIVGFLWRRSRRNRLRERDELERLRSQQR